MLGVWVVVVSIVMFDIKMTVWNGVAVVEDIFQRSVLTLDEMSK